MSGAPNPHDGASRDKPVDTTAGAAPDQLQARRYFQMLWPTPGLPGELAIWAQDGNKRRTIRWTRPESAAAVAAEISDANDVYVTVQLHDKRRSAAAWTQRTKKPDSPRDDQHRGCGESAVAIPGVWLDIDCLGGAHKAEGLPRKEQALEFLGDMELPPTLIVDSGGGLHVYWLFETPWVLSTAEDVAQAARVTTAFEQHIQRRFRGRGWALDSVSDLARVLRVPGTVNRKRSPVPVVIISCTDQGRFPRSAILDWCRVNNEVQSAGGESVGFRPQQPTEVDAEADLSGVLQGCAWLRRLFEDPQSQTEPQWYGALSIVGRCRDAQDAAHDLSRGHPDYREEDTDAKLRQAIDRSGPRTCASIHGELGGAGICDVCPSFGRITSP